MIRRGILRKMRVRLAEPAAYELPLDDELVPLNPSIGRQLYLEFSGEIHCIACGRRTNRSFSQGHCFPCMRSLARCDMCMVKPEQCHYHEGTCREPEWGQAQCMQDHVVYLALSSGLKVGITRQTQVPARWLDQGAVQALPVLKTANRYLAGLAEVAIKQHVGDRTDWRKMLKGDPPPVELRSRRDDLLERAKPGLDDLGRRFGEAAVTSLPEATPLVLQYPVRAYPEKIRALNLDKTPRISGTLQGIKGQYLILDTGVLNIRKYAGYRVSLELT